VWEVKLTEKAEEELKNNIRSRKINREDLAIIKIWIKQIQAYGPKYIQDEGKWDDHALYGIWEGFRSSCFSRPGRIIYRIIEKKIIVEVVRITPDHNYRSN
jgi:mRNA-degrading endonuclease YafQ of YafQ-DinJ toxin-antitoxin module